MGDASNDIPHPLGELDDRKPVDSLAAPPRPSAVGADGERISPGELESAAELSRMARGLDLDKRGVNGFLLYAAYLAYRDLRSRSARAFSRARTFARCRR